VKGTNVFLKYESLIYVYTWALWALPFKKSIDRGIWITHKCCALIQKEPPVLHPDTVCCICTYTSPCASSPPSYTRW